MQEKKLVSENGGPPMDDNYRVYHQFLVKEGWIERIKDYKHELLMPMIPNIEKNAVYQRMLTLLTGILVRTQRFTTDVFLKRLIGTRPTSEHTTTLCLSHSHVNDRTCRTYARRMVHAISMIASYIEDPHPTYKIHISPKLQTLVADLIQLLEENDDIEQDTSADEPVEGFEWAGGFDGDEERDEEERENEGEMDVDDSEQEKLEFTDPENKVFLVLWQLFTEVPKTSVDGPFYSPIFHYILLSSLQKQQQWTATTIVTQKLAALQFVGRLTFSSYIITKGRKDKCTHHE